MAKNDYMDADAAATFLGLTVQEFLLGRSNGIIPVTPKPKDPTPVYYRSDFEAWVEAGKPVSGPGKMGW